jgi:hypothetical protein
MKKRIFDLFHSSLHNNHMWLAIARTMNGRATHAKPAFAGYLIRLRREPSFA